MDSGREEENRMTRRGYTRILKTTLWTGAGQATWQDGRWASCGYSRQKSPGSSLVWAGIVPTR